MNIDRFKEQIDLMVNPVASAKGYDDKLIELVRDCVADHPMKHALGEIIYKVVRYSHTRRVDDILKVGAWAALVFEQHERHQVERMQPQHDFLTRVKHDQI